MRILTELPHIQHPGMALFLHGLADGLEKRVLPQAEARDTVFKHDRLEVPAYLGEKTGQV